jgi:hypothetical protein
MANIVKKVLFTECGVGTQMAQFFLVDLDAYDQKALEEYSWEAALQHAEGYGIYPESDKPEDFDEEENDGWSGDQYSDNIEGWWEDYIPEEHDGHVMGCGEVEWLEM